MALIGAAAVEVRPDLKNFQRDVRSEVTGSHMTRAGKEGGEQVASGFERGSSRIKGFLTGLAKTGAVALVGAATAAGGVGIATAAQLETANIAFTTMLGSAEKAQTFLGELQTFAAKTPFELPGLQRSAQSLISIGIESDKVIPIMTTLGNVTAGMGTGEEGIQRATVAIQQMNAAGKISAEDLNQLRDAGVPVFDLLTAATGKTTEEIADMASKGKLGREELEQLMTALETGKGLERFNGMMEKQSASLSGLWSTLKDTFSVGMAEAIEPIIPLLKDGLAGGISLVEQNIPKLRAGMEWLVEKAPSIRDWLGEAAEKVTTFVGSLRNADFSGVKTTLSPLLDAFKELGPSLRDTGDAAGPQLQSAVGGLSTALGFLSEHADTIVRWMPQILLGFAALKTVMAANQLLGRQSAIGMGLQVASTLSLAASNRALAASQKSVVASTTAQDVATKRGTVSTIAHTIAEKARTAAAKAGAVAQKALNLVMRANPIGLVVTAILGLVGILAVLYQRNETVREVVDRAWAAIKNGISAVVDWFTGTAWPMMRDALSWIGTKATGLYQDYIKPAFDNVRAKVSAVFSWVRDTGWPTFRDVLTSVGKKVTGLYQDYVKPGFDNIRDKISGAWDTAKGIFNRFKDGLSSLRDRFVSVKDGIARVWSSLGGSIARPINTVIGTVNDFLERLRRGLNKIPGVSIGGNWGAIPTVPVPAAQTSSASTAGRRFGSGAQMLADGGPVTGYSPNPRADNIPIWATAQEWMIRQAASLKMQRDFPGWLEYINRFGRPPGYADGGPVGGNLAGGSVWSAARSVLGSGWNWLKDVAGDALGWVRGLFREIMPDFGGSWPALVAKGAANSVVSQLSDWVRGKADAASAGQNPAPGSMMSWPYGWRSMFASGPDFHTGMDFRAATGTPVKAAGSGRVVVGGGWNHLGGRYVEIAHPSGVNSGYFHLSSALARSGQDVAAGQLIGRVGNTGAGSLGPHLHFQVGRGSVWNHFDPQDFLTPRLADSGAVLPPGDHWIRNRTGHYEILNPRLTGGGSGDPAGDLLAALEDFARNAGDEVYAGVRDGMVERARQVRRRTRAEVGSR